MAVDRFRIRKRLTRAWARQGGPLPDPEGMSAPRNPRGAAEVTAVAATPASRPPGPLTLTVRVRTASGTPGYAESGRAGIDRCPRPAHPARRRACQSEVRAAVQLPRQRAEGADSSAGRYFFKKYI